MTIDKLLDPILSGAEALAVNEVRKVIARPYQQLPASAPEYYWGKVVHETLVLLRFGSSGELFIRGRSGSLRSCGSG